MKQAQVLVEIADQLRKIDGTWSEANERARLEAKAGRLILNSLEAGAFGDLLFVVAATRQSAAKSGLRAALTTVLDQLRRIKNIAVSDALGDGVLLLADHIEAYSLRAAQERDGATPQVASRLQDGTFTKTISSVLLALEEIADRELDPNPHALAAIEAIANRIASGVSWDKGAAEREVAAGGPVIADAVYLIARLRAKYAPGKPLWMESFTHGVDAHKPEEPATSAKRLILALLSRVGPIYDGTATNLTAAMQTSVPWRRRNDAMPFPRECDRLGQSLADVESAIAIVGMMSEDVGKASSKHRSTAASKLTDACQRAQQAITAAQDAIPGVAARIDRHLEGRGVEWTSQLKQTLANLAGMLRREGGTAAMLQSQPWREALDEVAKKRCWLANADYSAVAPATVTTTTESRPVDDDDPRLWADPTWVVLHNAYLAMIDNPEYVFDKIPEAPEGLNVNELNCLAHAAGMTTSSVIEAPVEKHGDLDIRRWLVFHHPIVPRTVKLCVYDRTFPTVEPKTKVQRAIENLRAWRDLRRDQVLCMSTNPGHGAVTEVKHLAPSSQAPTLSNFDDGDIAKVRDAMAKIGAEAKAEQVMTAVRPMKRQTCLAIRRLLKAEHDRERSGNHGN